MEAEFCQQSDLDRRKPHDEFGGAMSFYRKVENALSGTNQGSFTAFNNTPATLPGGQTAGVVLATGVATNNLNTAIQTWANFLQGNNATFTQTKLDITADLRNKNFEGFARTMAYKRALTLSAGVRYSFVGRGRQDGRPNCVPGVGWARRRG